MRDDDPAHMIAQYDWIAVIVLIVCLVLLAWQGDGGMGW